MAPITIGRYIIKGELGRGGMATVYLAHDPRLEHDVAIKVLPQAFLEDPQLRIRFEREAKMIAKLDHPSIVPVYELGDHEGQPYIVMRNMSGGSLADRLRRGALSVEETSRIISRLASSLDTAHKNGIIHRDIKPGNVLFDQYAHAYLSDFGIAHLAQSTSATLTGENVIGTPSYMSPEQIQAAKTIDGRSDVYAVGVLIFQMLTGQLPYKADTPAQVMIKHILEPVPNILEAKASLPAGCYAIIQRAMAKNPADRYPSILELASALDSVAQGRQIPQAAPAGSETVFNRETLLAVQKPAIQAAAPASPPVAAPKRFPLLAIGAAVILLGGLVVGGFALLSRFSGLAAVIAPTIPVVVINQPSATQPVAQISSAPTILPTTAIPLVSVASETPITLTEPPTEMPAPSLTPTPEVLREVIGGADMVAFINADNIWVANLDGTELKQLTTNNAKKSNLQWMPDGSAINFISGKCVQSIAVPSGNVETLACFEVADFLEAFEISPDGQRVAISLNRELYIVPFDKERLSQARFRNTLIEMAECSSLGPFTHNGSVIAVKSVRWSKDGQKLSIVRLGVAAGKQVDLVHILDISTCLPSVPRLDEFPSQRFEMKGYKDSPYLQNFSWDGIELFVLFSVIRNDGFGDLWIYNSSLHKADKLTPIDGTCCYRDPQWSPDGRYLLFAFQDLRLAPAGPIQLYYVPFGAIGTGMRFAPLPLPPEFFSDPRGKPQPALRPAG
ncbi:MAG TPA: protein kinase [Anaerolineales bacterium]|nr:protein kinase [Anaerolineales bacterium]